jgi:hypothetical protein
LIRVTDFQDELAKQHDMYGEMLQLTQDLHDLLLTPEFGCSNSLALCHQHLAARQNLMLQIDESQDRVGEMVMEAPPEQLASTLTNLSTLLPVQREIQSISQQCEDLLKGKRAETVENSQSLQSGREALLTYGLRTSKQGIYLDHKEI